MRGSFAVFGVTNYWEQADSDHEIQQGKNLADAAKVCKMLRTVTSFTLC